MKLERKLLSVWTQITCSIKSGKVQRGHLVHYKSLVREYEKLQERYIKQTHNYWSPIRYEESRGRVE